MCAFSFAQTADGNSFRRIIYAIEHHGAAPAQSDLLKSAKAIHEAALKENRDLTEGEEQNHYKLLKALESLERDIIGEEEWLAYGSEGIPMPDENSLFAAAPHGQPIPDNPLSTRKKTSGRVGAKSWAEIFGQPRSNGGFKSFNEYLHAVRVAGEVFDPRLRQSQAESDLTSTGFLVPEQWSAIVLQRAIENSLCISRCQVWPMATNVLKVPGIKDPDLPAELFLVASPKFGTTKIRIWATRTSRLS